MRHSRSTPRLLLPIEREREQLPAHPSTRLFADSGLLCRHFLPLAHLAPSATGPTLNGPRACQTGTCSCQTQQYSLDSMQPSDASDNWIASLS